MRRGRDGGERLADVEMSGIIHETDKAVLFKALGGSKVWLPKSQIEYDSAARILVVTMPENLAIDRGLV